MTISFENNNIFSFKIDGYPIAFGLEDNPNHLTLFGKRWGALFKIDVFVKEPNGETGKHEKL